MNMQEPWGVGIIGCGLIGQKRAVSLGYRGKLVACADQDEKRAIRLAEHKQAKVFSDWQALINLPEVHVVIIATTHDKLAEITSHAVKAGKHVLVEKPGARNADELLPLLQLIAHSSVKVHVGYNHRYHRAIRQAKKLIDAEGLGKLMFIRGHYGHGGRLGYESEWRAQASFSGGGELIDQGSHLIDLSRWILGDFCEIHGHLQTYYWDIDVEDNAFITLKTKDNQIASLHASWTEWKNTFSLEIYGKKGKLEISGLGGSYGVERLTHYHLLPELGPPETCIWEYPMSDDSWTEEMNHFFDDICLDRPSTPSLLDAFETLKIIQTIYSQSNKDI